MPDLSKYTTTAKVWALHKFGGVGPRAFRALIARYGDIDSILNADTEELSTVKKLESKKIDKIARADKMLEEAERFIDALNIRDIKPTTLVDKTYPELFRELNDPPPIIFHRGKLPDQNEQRCAIVGSSEGTGEGIAVTVELARHLAEKNISTVSSLSPGIDAAVHLGAIKAEGTSYGVLGSGFDHIHPEENRPLAVDLAKNGGLISEYSPDTEYSAKQNRARNRLIVGLSQAVIIGELTGDSKETIDTATFCHQLGKLMFILTEYIEQPGRDNSGVEQVLKLGAIPVSLKEAFDMIPKSLV